MCRLIELVERRGVELVVATVAWDAGVGCGRRQLVELAWGSGFELVSPVV